MDSKRLLHEQVFQHATNEAAVLRHVSANGTNNAAVGAHACVERGLACSFGIEEWLRSRVSLLVRCS